MTDILLYSIFFVLVAFAILLSVAYANITDRQNRIYALLSQLESLTRGNLCVIKASVEGAHDSVLENADVLESVMDGIDQLKEMKEAYQNLQESCVEQKKAAESTNAFFTGLGNLWNYNPYQKKGDVSNDG